MNQAKYTKKGRLKRDCEQCKNYGGMLSKHYYLCTAEIMEYQTRIKCHDVYDIRVMKKGSCNLYIPKEIGNVILPDNITMECCIEEDDQSLPDEE